MIITLNLIWQAVFTSFCIGYKPARVFLPAGIVMLAISYYMWGDLNYENVCKTQW